MESNGSQISLRTVAPVLRTAEAFFFILFARLALSIIPFHHLATFMSLPTGKPELGGQKRREVRQEVKLSIFGAWRRMRFHNTCLHRALAAQAMLRRRGISTVLYYGAKTLTDRGLTGHVWLQDGSECIVGEQVAKGYHPLVRYPAGDAVN